MSSRKNEMTAGIGKNRLHDWACLAKQFHDAWDRAETEIKSGIRVQGLTILCQPGCVSCCYSYKLCSVSEAAAIVEWIDQTLDTGQAELIRMRVASTASSIAKLRAEGLCDSSDAFARAGGLECPFLQGGQCEIYPVRPLDCRLQMATSGANVDHCFHRPHAAGLAEAEAAGRRLVGELEEQERQHEVSGPPGQPSRSLVAELVGYLWENGEVAPEGVMTRNSWKQRLRSRGSPRDETWQDDRSDFRVLKRSLSLPEEGDIDPDLTVVNLDLPTQQLYDREINVQGLPSFPALYKREPGCRFDWEQRVFAWDQTAESEMPYAVWMSDGVQERLMMWEAAKRCRGRVLCGGLGLGLFPQLALSLPRVESVQVIEVDPAIIQLIEHSWQKKPWPRMVDCSVTAVSVEEYLKHTSERYDTIYVDTWDAVYHEYLPHVNEVSHLATRALRPGGEILLWAYDMMVRQFQDVARLLLERRTAYLSADAAQIGNIRRTYPLFHGLVDWLRKHPKCADEQLLTRAYRIATRERNTLGILKLTGTEVGGMRLLLQEMGRRGTND
jgi:Fe-S-cluster containining protein